MAGALTYTDTLVTSGKTAANDPLALSGVYTMFHRNCNFLLFFFFSNFVAMVLVVSVAWLESDTE